MTLKGVEILDAQRRTVLARYEENDLSRLYRFRALLPSPPRLNRSELRRIPSGRTGALFVGFTVDTPEALPSALTHRFTFEANPLIKLLRDASSAPDGTMVLKDFPVAVSRNKPLIVGPPLRGGPWKCSGGIDNNSFPKTTVLGNVANAHRNKTHPKGDEMTKRQTSFSGKFLFP